MYANNCTENSTSPPDIMHRLTSEDASVNRGHVPDARCHGNGGNGSRSCGRTVFTRAQLDAMEKRFVRQSFLTREERIELADEIQLSEKQILVWFQNRRGRLKRKGASDKAYEQKRYYDSARSDAKSTAFLAEIASTRQLVGSAAFSHRKSTKSCDNVGGVYQAVSANYIEMMQEEARNQPLLIGSRITSMDNGGVHTTQSHLDLDSRVNKIMMEQTQLNGSQYGVQYGSTTQRQTVYQPSSLQDNGVATTACVWERRSTAWPVLDQSYHTQHLVNPAGQTQISTWFDYSLTPQPNYDSVNSSPSAYCDNTDSSLSTPCWPYSQMMTSCWLNTNHR